MSQKKNCLELVENILAEINDLPRGPFWFRDVVVEQRYTFPVTLDVGNAGYIYINPEINRKIGSLSEAILDAFFGNKKSAFTGPEWSKLVKIAFGSALVRSNDEVTANRQPADILKAVVEELRSRIQNIGEQEHVFACHFCNIPDLEPPSIGPVRFEPRHLWLDRMYDSGHISKVSLSRIPRVWRGECLRKGRRHAIKR